MQSKLQAPSAKATMPPSKKRRRRPGLRSGGNSTNSLLKTIAPQDRAQDARRPQCWVPFVKIREKRRAILKANARDYPNKWRAWLMLGKFGGASCLQLASAGPANSIKLITRSHFE